MKTLLCHKTFQVIIISCTYNNTAPRAATGAPPQNRKGSSMVVYDTSNTGRGNRNKKKIQGALIIGMARGSTSAILMPWLASLQLSGKSRNKNALKW